MMLSIIKKKNYISKIILKTIVLNCIEILLKFKTIAVLTEF